MELMSTLLFCVFLTHVPLVLGTSKDLIAEQNVKYNFSKHIHRDPNKHKRVLLNLNGPPLVNGNSAIQTVFSDLSCQNCIPCMERALKAHHIKNRIQNYRPTIEELHNEVPVDLNRDEIKRDKRDVMNEQVVKKKIKMKKSNDHKVVTVTKYQIGDEVYALKVKEIRAQKTGDPNPPVIKCQLFNVNNSFPCGTPDGPKFLANARRKMNKKNKKDKHNITAIPTTVPPQVRTTVIKKRHVDNSHVSESFMPSIEELY